MAVLVNFSKLIAGFLIDFFQVIMLTFVNGFKDVLGGNFAEGFGLYKMLSLASDASSFGEKTDLNYYNIAIASVIAVILLIVANMTVLIMAAVLLWRIAMLWVLIIISPLAYLSYAFMPKYWSEWWQMFFQHLVSGPVIAFFLWLSLLTIQQENIADKFNVSGNDEQKKEKIDAIFSTNINNELLLQYMVMLALLMGGLTISQKIAAQSGSAVGSFAQKVQKVGTRAAMLGTGVAAAGWALKKAPGYLNERQAALTGVSLNYKDWKESFGKARERTKKKRMYKALGNMDEITNRGIANSVMDKFFFRRTRSGWAQDKQKKTQKDIQTLENELNTPNLGAQYRNEMGKTVGSNNEEIEKLNIEQSDFEKSRTEKWKQIDEDNKKNPYINWDENTREQKKQEFDTDTRLQSEERMRKGIDLLQENEEIEKLMAMDDNQLEKVKKQEISSDIKDLEAKLKVTVDKAEEEKIQDQIDSLNIQLQFRPLTEAERSNIQSRIADLRSQESKQGMKKTKLMPETGYWRAARAREMEAEEYKKVQFEENSDVLVDSFKKAVLDKDQARVAAIGMKLAKDANMNEVLNAYGKDSGKNGMKGTREFFEEIIKGKAGFSDEDMHRLASDMSYNAESVNHWSQARINTKENGKYRWNTEAEHSHLINNEMLKRHQQIQARTYGRLAEGGEEYNPKTGEWEYGLSPAGMMFESNAGYDMLMHDSKNVQASKLANMLKSELSRNELTQAEMRGLLPKGYVELFMKVVKERKIDALLKSPNSKSVEDDYENIIAQMKNMRNYS